MTFGGLKQALITQEMIARRAGYSVSTVSLALRNDARLTAATRETIQAVAREMGYAPNPLISVLMTRIRQRRAGYRGTLAYVHTLARDEPLLANPVYRNYLRGARERAGELGYRIEEYFLGRDATPPARLPALLQARGIPGAVIEHGIGPSCEGRRLPFDVGRLACAVLGVPLVEPHLHYAANDQFMRPVLAARELLALGYRRLGLILAPALDARMNHRCSAGFWAVQGHAPIERLPICWLAEDAPEAVARWLKKHRPDAVMSLALPALPLLRKLGVNIPRALGFVTLDWLPSMKDVAGIYGHSEDTGAAAVELVVSQILRGETGPPARAMSFLVSGSWLPGGTVRRVGPPLELNTTFYFEERPQ